jgi:hypothetical protein
VSSSRRRRWPIVVLALVGASLFAISVQAGAWWTAGEFEIGPFGSRACLGGDCNARGLRWVIEASGGASSSDLWLRAALAAGAAGIIAMIALVVMAGATAAGPARDADRLSGIARLAAKSSLAALVTTLVAGVWFVVGFPGLPNAHVDRGAAFYAVAIVAGTIAAVQALRWR